MRILFVCTGNICRSPMAEGLFRDMTRNIPDVHIESAGMGATQGQVPSHNALAVMNELGIDISYQRSQPITEELIQNFDYILVMTYGHLDTLLMFYPKATEKAFLIREFIPNLPPEQREVSDPIGGPESVYRICRDQIHEALNYFLPIIQNADKIPLGSVAPPYPNKKKIALAAERSTSSVKETLCHYLQENNHHLIDFGPHKEEPKSSDPSFKITPHANKVAQYIIEGKADLGVLLTNATFVQPCRDTYPTIRTSYIKNPEEFSTTHLNEEYSHAKILCLAVGKFTANNTQEIIETWLNAKNTESDHQSITTGQQIMETTKNQYHYFKQPLHLQTQIQK